MSLSTSEHKEFFGRLKTAFQISTDVELEKLDPERVQGALEAAAMLAEEAFQGRLCYNPEEVRIAAQAVSRQAIACGDLPIIEGCGSFKICAANSVIIARGDKNQINQDLAQESLMRFPCHNHDCQKHEFYQRPVEIAPTSNCLDIVHDFSRSR